MPSVCYRDPGMKFARGSSPNLFSGDLKDPFPGAASCGSSRSSPRRTGRAVREKRRGGTRGASLPRAPWGCRALRSGGGARGRGRPGEGARWPRLRREPRGRGAAGRWRGAERGERSGGERSAARLPIAVTPDRPEHPAPVSTLLCRVPSVPRAIGAPRAIGPRRGCLGLQPAACTAASIAQP